MITEELYAELKKITEEEARILNGDTKIETEIYMSQEAGVRDAYIVDAKKLLDAGKLIQVRPHTRFIHFPKHTHNYIEMIYMCCGSLDPLLDDSNFLATVLSDRGVPVQLDVVPGVLHAFMHYGRMMPEAVECLEHSGAFFRAQLNPQA